MESLYMDVKKWFSDPIVVMLLAFIATSALLKLISALRARKK